MIHQSRVARIRKHLKGLDVDMLIVEEPVMLYYTTGQQFSAGTLLIHQESEVLLVDSRYHESATDKSPLPVALKEEKALEEWLGKAPFNTSKTIGFDSVHTSYRQYKILSDTVEKVIPGVELQGIDGIMNTLRAVKDESEMELLRAAGELGCRGFDFVCDQLQEGITEKEVAKRLEIFWLENGGAGSAFDPIIAFGPHTSMPHYHPTEYPLETGHPVLIDIGVSLNCYQSDMTRTLFFGEPTVEMQKVYDIVLAAQLAALEACREGVTAGELDQAARSVIEQAGYGKEFCHSLGHGVGLNVHESPGLSSKGAAKDKLIESGMVITIEPGIYLPGVGGVRIEDTVIITKDGCENLTPRSKELSLLPA